MKKIYLIALASLIIILSGCSKDAKDTAKEATLTPKEATQIAKEAYVYGFPLVLKEPLKKSLLNEIIATS